MEILNQPDVSCQPHIDSKKDLTVKGKYKVFKAIGKGKFSVVYQGERISDNLMVAVKKIAIADMMDEKSKEKCLKEVRLLQSLRHPQIIQYLDSFLEDGDLIIIFEWAQAGDLKKQIKKAIKKGMHFEERVIWKYFYQMVEAVKYMHEHRVMHRDLKPANIFLTCDAKIKIGDLGLGRAFSENTMEAFSKVGTPLYMSPEVLKGNGYEWSSDIWSLGCILYELAVLRSPFKEEGLNLYGLFQKISKGIYPPIDNIYSDDLRNLVGVMLTLDPRERPDIQAISKLARSMLVKFSTSNKKGIKISSTALENDDDGNNDKGKMLKSFSIQQLSTAYINNNNENENGMVNNNDEGKVLLVDRKNVGDINNNENSDAIIVNKQIIISATNSTTPPSMSINMVDKWKKSVASKMLAANNKSKNNLSLLENNNNDENEISLSNKNVIINNNMKKDKIFSSSNDSDIPLVVNKKRGGKKDIILRSNIISPSRNVIVNNEITDACVAAVELKKEKEEKAATNEMPVKLNEERSWLGFEFVDLISEHFKLLDFSSNSDKFHFYQNKTKANDQRFSDLLLLIKRLLKLIKIDLNLRNDEYSKDIIVATELLNKITEVGIENEIVSQITPSSIVKGFGLNVLMLLYGITTFLIRQLELEKRNSLKYDSTAEEEITSFVYQINNQERNEDELIEEEVYCFDKSSMNDAQCNFPSPSSYSFLPIMTCSNIVSSEDWRKEYNNVKHKLKRDNAKAIVSENNSLLLSSSSDRYEIIKESSEVISSTAPLISNKLFLLLKSNDEDMISIQSLEKKIPFNRENFENIQSIANKEKKIVELRRIILVKSEELDNISNENETMGNLVKEKSLALSDVSSIKGIKKAISSLKSEIKDLDVKIRYLNRNLMRNRVLQDYERKEEDDEL